MSICTGAQQPRDRSETGRFRGHLACMFLLHGHPDAQCKLRAEAFDGQVMVIEVTCDSKHSSQFMFYLVSVDERMSGHAAQAVTFEVEQKTVIVPIFRKRCAFQAKPIFCNAKPDLNGGEATT